jgi:hypothetical protein
MQVGRQYNFYDSKERPDRELHGRVVCTLKGRQILTLLVVMGVSLHSTHI